MNIKRLILVVGMLLVGAALSLFGEVKFQLHFDDPRGTGFNAHGREWMRQEAQEAVESLGKIIKQNAVIHVKVTQTDQTPIAWAPNNYIYNNRYAIQNAHQKIVKAGAMGMGQGLDAHIEFNMRFFDKQQNKAHFKTMVVHELTHILGYSGDLVNTVMYREVNTYTDFDKLIQDGQGQRYLIKRGDGAQYMLNPKFNRNYGVFLCGPNIKKHNNGRCVQLYNPRDVANEEGTAFTHPDLDMKEYQGDIMGRHPHKYKIWNGRELGVLEDIGYEIDYDVYQAEFERLHGNRSFTRTV